MSKWFIAIENRQIVVKTPMTSNFNLEKSVKLEFLNSEIFYNVKKI